MPLESHFFRIYKRKLECIPVQVVSRFFGTAKVVLGSVYRMVQRSNLGAFLASMRYSLRILVFKYLKFNEKLSVQILQRLLLLLAQKLNKALGGENH